MDFSADLVLISVALFFLGLSGFYYSKKRLFIQPSSQVLKDGYNKIKITALLYDTHVATWDAEKVLFHQMRAVGTKPGGQSEILFSEPNKFIAKLNATNFVVDSEKITFCFNLETKKHIKIPLKELGRIIENRKSIRELYQYYYFNNPDLGETRQANTKFAELKIKEGGQYYLIAKFDNKKIDVKKPVYLIDREIWMRKAVYLMTLFIAMPAIVLMFIIISQ